MGYIETHIECIRVESRDCRWAHEHVYVIVNTLTHTHCTCAALIPGHDGLLLLCVRCVRASLLLGHHTHSSDDGVVVASVRTLDVAR